MPRMYIRICFLKRYQQCRLTSQFPEIAPRLLAAWHQQLNFIPSRGGDVTVKIRIKQFPSKEVIRIAATRTDKAISRIRSPTLARMFLKGD